VAYDTSADGSVVVGDTGNEAFRWTSGTGAVGLGDLPGGSDDSEASGVSADGSVVVGSGTSASGVEAFRWTSGTGMVGLGDLPGGSPGSKALAISGDGSAIVGWGIDPGAQAFRWTSGTGMVGLGYIPGGGAASEAWGVSADGSVIVGGGDSASSFAEAFRWTSGTGMVGLGDLAGGSFLSFAWDVSADGSVVVGYGTTAVGTEAFIWDAGHGMRNLKEVLTDDYGLDLTGWTLEIAYGISADGRTIVGNGNHGGWVAVIPEPSTWVLLVLGSAMLGVLRLRQRVAQR
jgi:probable HAF family extracellular repeat protein